MAYHKSRDEMQCMTCKGIACHIVDLNHKTLHGDRVRPLTLSVIHMTVGAYVEVLLQHTAKD